MQKLDRTLNRNDIEELTWREQEILALLAERLSNREIADRLHLAESTVKDYVSRILSKLYVKNRRQAVERAEVLGLLEAGQDKEPRARINLPLQPTPFIGREAELAQVRGILKETRMLTLLGPGGIGKTRLAIQVAHQLQESFTDGCAFVSLAPIQRSRDMVQTIAEALRYPLATQENPQKQLLRHLKGQQLLLVMDNFEHLLVGAGLISEILKTAPGVKVLVTSREKLKIQGEFTLPVSGMAFPDQADAPDLLDYDAIRLFYQLAGRVDPGFAPSAEDMTPVLQICKIVGGMPLAIELAASWLHVLTIQEIAAELESDLDLLSTEMRDAPRRHRSIRAVCDQTWSMLDLNEQETFKRLSVFKGGFTLQAAQAVTGTSFQRLGRLINKSLIKRDTSTGRMAVHELLRQYAQEQLERSPEAQRSTSTKHAAYYAEFMQQQWQNLKDHRQMGALAGMEADIENIRTAWRSFLAQKDGAQIDKFIKPFWMLYWIRGWNLAGMELLGEAVQALDGEQGQKARGVRALAMALQGYFMAWLELAEAGFELTQKSIKILTPMDDPLALALAYDSLAVNAYMCHRYDVENWASQEMLKIANQAGDPWLLAFTYFAAAMGALLRGDSEEARSLALKQIQLARELGEEILSSMPYIVLGHFALTRESYPEARDHYQHCLKTSQKSGFYYGIQTSTKYLGKVLLLMGNTRRAEQYLESCLVMTHKAGFVRDTVKLLYEFACLRAAQDQPEQAVELLGLVLHHPSSHQASWWEGEIRTNARGLLDQLKHELSTQQFDAGLNRGQASDLERAVAGLIQQGQLKPS